jgi:hypothetical protein
MKVPYIPMELLHIILEYDGRIKYKNGKYVNIIAKNDKRYDIITPCICKKMEILKTITISSDGSFYFQFGFDTINNVGLCYDLGFNECDVFEICYYDTKNTGWQQIRTYI